MLLLFQEKERINSILMEYQRKKAVSILHIIFPPSTVTHAAFSPCFNSGTIMVSLCYKKKFGENCNSNYAVSQFFCDFVFLSHVAGLVLNKN